MPTLLMLMLVSTTPADEKPFTVHVALGGRADSATRFDSGAAIPAGGALSGGVRVRATERLAFGGLFSLGYYPGMAGPPICCDVVEVDYLLLGRIGPSISAEFGSLVLDAAVQYELAAARLRGGFTGRGGFGARHGAAVTAGAEWQFPISASLLLGPRLELHAGTAGAGAFLGLSFAFR